MPIFRRTNCIITAYGIVALYKRLHSMPDESRLFHGGVFAGSVSRGTAQHVVSLQSYKKGRGWGDGPGRSV